MGDRADKLKVIQENKLRIWDFIEHTKQQDEDPTSTLTWYAVQLLKGAIESEIHDAEFQVGSMNESPTSTFTRSRERMDALYKALIHVGGAVEALDPTREK